jgi:hypothetical protein
MTMSKPTTLTRTPALAALAWAATAIAFACWLAPGPAFAQDRTGPPDFEMAAQEGPFRSVAEEFVAAAAASDRTKIARMLSPAIAATTGAEGVERFLTDEVLPFFAPFKEFAGSVSITRTADVTGFVFYLYMVSNTDDELRPFVIYVIEEGGTKVVATVLVDHFVEGRHCARAGGGWKCPDFS